MYSHLHIKENEKFSPFALAPCHSEHPPVIPSAARNLHLRIHTMSFRSAARNLPPSHSVRGTGECPHVIPAQAGIQREGRGKSWQSLPHHGNHGSKPPPFAFTPCHSEQPPVIPKRSEESPPFAQRKGPGGCPHVILAKAGIQRGREGKIMAIITPSWQSGSKPSPSHSPPVIPSTARNL